MDTHYKLLVGCMHENIIYDSYTVGVQMQVHVVCSIKHGQ